MYKKTILHIDFNSYFATVEQQANPRLRDKPIGVTGGDRLPASPTPVSTRSIRGGQRGEQRTVLGAASIEAKKFGVKTGMQIWEAKKLCPEIILVAGDSDKYFENSKRFLNILKDYSPNLEVFSIDEAFLEITPVILSEAKNIYPSPSVQDDKIINIAREIKNRIKSEIGEYITCSIGISYNKLMAKLAGSLYKPDGLVVIEDAQAAQFILDRIELDEVCGIGTRIKKRLLNMGIANFKNLRKVDKEILVASFKSYGEVLYNMSRGIDERPIVPFFEKEDVKSIGHRHTIDHDTDNLQEIKQIFLKLSEMIGKRARDKKLVGKTIHVGFRYAFVFPYTNFEGGSMQITITHTQDGLEIFQASWKIFNQIWNGEKVRMVGISLSNLKSINLQTLSLLPQIEKRETLLKVMDKINNKFGDFTLQTGTLINSTKITRKPNPFLSDRRFKI